VAAEVAVFGGVTAGAANEDGDVAGSGKTVNSGDEVSASRSESLSDASLAH